MNLVKCLDCPKEDDPKNMVHLYRCHQCSAEYCSCGTKYFHGVKYQVWLDDEMLFKTFLSTCIGENYCYYHCRKLQDRIRMHNEAGMKWTVKEIKNLKVTALSIEPCSNDPKITADTSSDGAAKDENIIIP